MNGVTNYIKTPSGSLINNTSGYYPCRYRYIENPWGNQRDAIYQIKASMDNDKLSYIYNKNISEDLLDETNNIIYNTDISENGTYGMSYNNSPFILPISSGNDSNITIDSVNIDTNKTLPIYIGVDVNYKNDLSGFTIINIGNLPNTTNNDNINNSISSRLSYITK